MAPSKLHLLKLHPSGTVFGDGVFKEAVKVKRGHEGGPLILIRRRETPGMCVHRGRPCDDVGRREPWASQGERPQETSDPQHLE